MPLSIPQPVRCVSSAPPPALSRAALYDAIYEGRGADVAVYLGLALPSPGPVLELGAGSGRLLAPLLAKGIDAWGLDCDPDMLGAGWRRLASLGGSRLRQRLIDDDMRSFALDNRFSLIIVACNTLSLLLHDEELLATLERAKRHLKPDGVLALDVSRVEGHSWFVAPYVWQGQTEAVWVDGTAATSTETGCFDPVTRHCTVRREFRLVDGRKADTTTLTRQRSIEAIVGLMERAGFSVGAPRDESGGAVSAQSTLAFIRAVSEHP